MSNERVQYDGDLGHLDEIVAYGVDLHIEAMDSHLWSIIATRPEALFNGPSFRPPVEIMLQAYNLTQVTEATGLPVRMDPPLLICSEWFDRRGVRHQCTRRHHSNELTALLHKCYSCGATSRQS